MKNSDLFYKAARGFQDARKGIMDAYDKRVAELEKMKGSAYFKEEMEKAETAKNEGLKALRSEYHKQFNTFLDMMRTANDKRAMKAPTEEQLRILQLMKMKDTVTHKDLRSAAMALQDNGSCLEALQEIARKHGVMRDYTHYGAVTELSVDDVDKTISAIATGLRDFMMFDTKKTGRVEKAYHERMYGDLVDAKLLAKRELFDSKAGCFAEIARIDSGIVDAFCTAVDGGEA